MDGDSSKEDTPAITNKDSLTVDILIDNRDIPTIISNKDTERHTAVMHMAHTRCHLALKGMKVGAMTTGTDSHHLGESASTKTR